MTKTLLAFALLSGVVAQSAIAFELPWMNGPSGTATYRSSDHPHSVFVVEAFFNACHWCHANAPTVARLADDYKSDSRVQVVDVGVDASDREFSSWISETNPNHPVLKDSRGRSFLRSFNINGYPTTILVGCNGVEKYRHVGSFQGEEQELKDQIRSALDAPECK